MGERLPDILPLFEVKLVKANPRKISVLVAQFPITLDTRQNLETMFSIISGSDPGDLIVLPEGALSGYAQDPAFLHDVNVVLLTESLRLLQAEVMRRQLHLIFGSCLLENKSWYNAGIYYGPQGETFVYRKINLATNERGHFRAGSQLPILEVFLGGSNVKLGIQLCREIRFPEQWQYLARAGAEVFVYLTNAVGDATQAPVWRSHLISRAAENQRFVLGVNNAQAEQKCPSMIVAPSGQVVWEVLSSKVEKMRCTLDVAEVSGWYLSQSREDVVGAQTNF